MRRLLPSYAFRLIILGAAVGLVAAPAHAQPFSPAMPDFPQQTTAAEQPPEAQLRNSPAPAPCNCCPAPRCNGCPTAPGGPAGPDGTAPAPQGNAEAPSFSSPSFGAGLGSSVALAVPAGSGAASSVAGNGILSVSSPVILPGLFTAATAQSAMPLDRIWFNYGYYDSMRINNPTSLIPGTMNTQQIGGAHGTQPGFSLNVFDLGVEKTFFDGWFSVYLDVPLLYAANNSSGQDISGIGDVNVGFKAVLLRDWQTGSVLSAGMSVAAPTGHETVVSNNICTCFIPTATGPTTLATQTTTTLNPTYIQPWIAGLWRMDRFYVQEYFGVIVPSDDRVSTILNNSLVMGLNVYQSRGGLISSVTPMVGTQALIPVTHIGASGTGVLAPLPAAIPVNGPVPPAPNSFGFPDQLFLTGGVQFGLNDRALLSTAVVVPVVGPVGYSYGLTIGLNFFY